MLLLNEIRKKAAFAKTHEDNLMEYARLLTEEETGRDTRKAQSDLVKYRCRETELDLILKRLFEQSELGTMTESRFLTFSRGYEAEQAELWDKIADIEQKTIKRKSDNENAVKFYDIVLEYTNIDELTVSILHEMIDHIKIYTAVGLGKSRTQRVEINYRLVGLLLNPSTSQ